VQLIKSATKGFIKSYSVSVVSNDPLEQLACTKKQFNLNYFQT